MVAGIGCVGYTWWQVLGVWGTHGGRYWGVWGTHGSRYWINELWMQPEICSSCKHSLKIEHHVAAVDELKVHIYYYYCYCKLVKITPTASVITVKLMSSQQCACLITKLYWYGL